MSLAKKLLFSLITVTLFFSGAEGIARLFVPPPDSELHRDHVQIIDTLGLPALNDTMIPDPLLFWSLKPGLKQMVVAGHIRDTAVRFTLSTDSQGLRGPEIGRRKKGFRILAVGDSTTFGLGVNDDQAWPAVLERILRERTGRPVEVLNAGVPGYSSFQGLLYLEDRGFALAPDLVVATFGINDADSWSYRSDMETARLLALHRWERPLLHSRLYTGLKGLLDRAGGPPAHPEKRPRLSLREFYLTLSRIHRECASRNISLVLVIWPYRIQKTSGDSRLVIAQPVVAAFARRENVPVVNLVDDFGRADGNLFLDHVHASAAGCRVAAEALSPVCRGLMEEKAGD